MGDDLDDLQAYGQGLDDADGAGRRARAVALTASGARPVGGRPATTPPVAAAARPESSPRDTGRTRPRILPPARLEEDLAGLAAEPAGPPVATRVEAPAALPHDPLPAPTGPADPLDLADPVGPAEHDPYEVAGLDVAAAYRPRFHPTPADRAAAVRAATALDPRPADPGPADAGPPEAAPTAAPAPTQAEELATVLREHPRAAAAFAAMSAAAAAESDDAEPDDDPELDRSGRRSPEGAGDRQRPQPSTAAVEQTVEEVADAVISAMRRVGEAHERHLAAAALETARRHELLTAQAELDAELIRLHARREAHAILAAARTRAGAPTPGPGSRPEAAPGRPEGLREIGETFSRFAERVETTLGLGTTGPERPD
jgi:hypothetical protein